MVTTDTLIRTERIEPAAPVAERGRRARSRRLRVRFSRFTVGSAVSTTVSQLVLTGTYGWLGAGAAVASSLAFLAGAIPAFLINWHWTWGRRGRPDVIRELVPYLVITIGGGFAATSLTALADRFIDPLISGRAWQTVVLDGVYLASYGLLFVIKFALLNRTLAPGRGQRDEPDIDVAGAGSPA